MKRRGSENESPARSAAGSRQAAAASAGVTQLSSSPGAARCQTAPSVVVVRSVARKSSAARPQRGGRGAGGGGPTSGRGGSSSTASGPGGRGESPSTAGEYRPPQSSDVLELFPGLEAHRLAGRDRHFHAGLGVTAHALLALPDLEDPETAQLDPLAGAKGVLHRVDDRVDRQGRLHPRDFRQLGHAVDDVSLDHSVSEKAAASVATGL